jgi:hypothetical protein
MYLLVGRQICNAYPRGRPGSANRSTRHDFGRGLHLLHHLWIDDYSSAELLSSLGMGFSGWISTLFRPLTEYGTTLSYTSAMPVP